MTKIYQVIFVGLILIIAMQLFAQNKIPYIFVTWNENIEADLAGYKVYCRNEFLIADTFDVKLEDQLLLKNHLFENIRYFFSVTAYDTAGNESEHSDVTMFRQIVIRDTIPPDKPIDKPIVKELIERK